MIDFDKLVLRPAMAVFGEAIVVRPISSQPALAAYAGTGIFSQRPISVQLEEGGVHSTVQTTLGLRLSTFAVPPGPDDLIQVRGTWYVVFDSNPDGQGGATLDLRQVQTSSS